MASENPSAARQLAGHESGAALLQELLNRSPKDIANWALDQAQELSRPGVSVENQPIFQVAGALNSVPTAQKQTLVRHAIAGFGELPKQRRTEAIRLAMQTANAVQQATGDQSASNSSKLQGVVDASLPAQEKTSTLSCTVSKSPAEQAQSSKHPLLHNHGSLGYVSGRQGDYATGSGPPSPPLVQNLVRVVNEVKISEMPQSDVAAVAQAAQSEATKLAQPQQLLDVVSELDEGEREQLTEVLVEAHVVPEEQRGLLEEAVRPGGYADKLSRALEWINTVREYSWVGAVLPIAEVVLAALVGLLPCGTPLVLWLRFDSLLAALAAICVCVSGHILAPVYRRLASDPVGAVQRWQTSPEELRSWRKRLEIAVPGVDFETYRMGGVGLAATVVLVLVGAVWACVGVLEILASAAFGCHVVIVLLCAFFVCLRFGLVVGMMLFLFYILDEIQRHRSRAPMLGSSLLPMSEDALPYDGFAPQREPPRPPPTRPDDFV